MHLDPIVSCAQDVSELTIRPLGQILSGPEHPSHLLGARAEFRCGASFRAFYLGFHLRPIPAAEKASLSSRAFMMSSSLFGTVRKSFLPEKCLS